LSVIEAALLVCAELLDVLTIYREQYRCKFYFRSRHDPARLPGPPAVAA